MAPSTTPSWRSSWREGTDRLRGAFRGLPTVTRAALLTLGASYVLFLVLAMLIEGGWPVLEHWLALTPNRVHLRPWSLITMALLHRDPMHLLFNVLALWSLGPHVERSLGGRPYGILMLASTLGGSLLYALTGLLLQPGTPAIGASGGILGVLCAFALLFPRSELQFFFAGRMAARHLPWVLLGVDLILRLAGMPIAVFAHVGGMIGAWAYLRRPWTPGGRQQIRRFLDRIR
ncbi:MAG TPA: rhomboid family intramembrane serine protease [Myxococcota bacterium]|nr:rhomboid family intramembrane serine protease [Myxococcota bacterium]HQK50318.1 rhomboid family intramembrane serine protease [Myxococcota bacterium]